MIMNEIRPLTQQDVLEALDLLRPWATRRTPKVRVGNDYDGGYVLPAVALQCDVVLSIGVGHDVSFDHVMAERGARILQFDHTVEGPPTPHAQGYLQPYFCSISARISPRRKRPPDPCAVQLIVNHNFAAI